MKPLFLFLFIITLGQVQIANPSDTLLANVRKKIALINYTTVLPNLIQNIIVDGLK